MRYLLSLSWRILAVLLPLVAVLTIILRAGLWWLPEQRTMLEQQLGDMLQTPVSIGVVGGFWRHTGPVLNMADVRVGDEGTSVVRIDSVSARIDILQSLFSLQLVIDRLNLHLDEVNVLRSNDGSFTLHDIELLDRRVRRKDARDWFVSVDTITASLQRLVITPEDKSRPELELHAAEFLLRERDGEYHAAGHALIHQGAEGRVSFAGRFMPWGDGRFYLDVRGLRPARWLAGLTDTAIVTDATMDVLSWARWDGRRIRSASGKVVIHDARAQLGDGVSAPTRVVALDAASGRWRWRRQKQGWRIDVEDFSLARNGQTSESGGLALQMKETRGDDPVRTLNFGIDRLALGAFAAMTVSSNVLEELHSTRLDDLGLQGELRDLRVRLEQRQDAPDRIAFAGHVEGLNANPLGSVPGVRGLSATFRGTPSTVVARLQGDDVSVHAARWFTDPLPSAIVDGQVEYRRHDAGWKVTSHGLRFDTADIRSVARLVLSGGEHEPALIDLQLDHTDLDIADVEYYLPDLLMPPTVVAWLKDGLAAGKGVRASTLVHGDLSGFPWRDASGRFQVLLDVEDAVVRYDPAWPPMEGISAGIMFDAASMDIRLRQGRIFTSDISGTRLQIPELQKQPMLLVDGPARGPVSDALRFLAESPLREQTGGYLADARGQGDSDMQMSLRLPLYQPAPPTMVDIDLTLSDGGLNFVEQGLDLQAINGKLHITSDSLTGKGIRARLFGRPLVIQVSTPDEGGAVFSAGGRMTGRQLVRELPGARPGWFAGKTDWSGRLVLPSAKQDPKPPVTLTMESMLKGLEIKLPEPVAKAAGEKRKLRFVTSFGASGGQGFVVDYGDNVRATLANEAAGQDDTLALRGEIRFGGDGARLSDKPGLRLGGRLPELDVDAWLAALADASTGGGNVMTGVDLEIAALRWAARDFNAVQARLQEVNGIWTGTVESEELSGHVSVPVRDWPEQPVRFKLAHLLWDVDETEQPDSGDPLDPRDFPPLHIEAERFRFQDIELGALLLRTARTDSGMRVDELRLESDPLTVQARGAWETVDDGQRSSLYAELTAPAIEPALALLDKQSGITEGPTEAKLDVSWSGGPGDYALAALNGQLDATIGQGKFLEINPGVGRVAGLLSLTTLRRRLSLDFSDLFGEGFSFDEIRAKLQLSEGIADTKKLRLKGPAVHVEVTGLVDLEAEVYDQVAEVTPQVTASLPVAGAIAGGPAVGAALYLADKLIGSEVNRITTVRYRIRGSWDEPEVVRLDRDGNEIPDESPGRPAPDS